MNIHGAIICPRCDEEVDIAETKPGKYSALCLKCGQYTNEDTVQESCEESLQEQADELYEAIGD